MVRSARLSIYRQFQWYPIENFTTRCVWRHTQRQRLLIIGRFFDQSDTFILSYYCYTVIESWYHHVFHVLKCRNFYDFHKNAFVFFFYFLPLSRKTWKYIYKTKKKKSRVTVVAVQLESSTIIRVAYKKKKKNNPERPEGTPTFLESPFNVLRECQ